MKIFSEFFHLRIRIESILLGRGIFTRGDHNHAVNNIKSTFILIINLGNNLIDISEYHESCHNRAAIFTLLLGNIQVI